MSAEYSEKHKLEKGMISRLLTTILILGKIK